MGEHAGMSTHEAELRQAETDLAFALAQGDGYAEDEAAERIARIKREIQEEQDAAEAGNR